MAGTTKNNRNTIRRLLAELIRIPTKDKAPDEQRLSRLLSVLLITLAPTTLLFATFPTTWEISPQLVLNPVAITAYILELFFLIAYLINRKGHYRIASTISIGIMTVMSFLISILVDINMLPFMIIPLLFSSLLSPFSELLKWILLHHILLLTIPIYIPTTTYIDIIAGIFEFFLLFSVVLIIARKQRDNLEKDRMQEVTEAKNWLFITLRSIGDAVIATDKNGKVKFMNPVAEKLTGWEQSKAKGKPVNRVFCIVNEKTRERIDNPVVKVLKVGTIIGLANHTLLISKNGKEIPISDSGAPITNLLGQITGVVLVFRDVTERRKKEHTINEKLKEADIFMNAALDREERIRELKKTVEDIEEKLRNKEK